MGRRHRHVIDDDDVYMYPTDMHPNEWHAYTEVVRTLKAVEWNRKQEEHFVKGKRKTGIILI